MSWRPGGGWPLLKLVRDQGKLGGWSVDGQGDVHKGVGVWVVPESESCTVTRLRRCCWEYRSIWWYWGCVGCIGALC